MAFIHDHPRVRLRFQTKEFIEARDLTAIIVDLQMVSSLAVVAAGVWSLGRFQSNFVPYSSLPYTAISFSEIHFASPLGLEYVFKDLPKELATQAVKNTGEIFRRLIMPAQMEARADLKNDLLREEVKRKRLENVAMALDVFERLPPDMQKPWLDETLGLQSRFEQHPKIIEATFDNVATVVERSDNLQPDSEEGPFETDF
ncbi:hypothetical protein [Rhizobium ruizarguesonis]|uniref:Uncharacterized protein n=1 Tax=Rhizobium ruizarguesonis TaxID=2081791 RepID=A0AAE8TXY5_9HYPH|nr:hypothetical protein [Rhizobium ruizarguesonis]TBC12713.1 hypothetical protein ELH35_38075 [Rhizobium ruizarguesonis]TBF00959.1 hypothetical protein ELG94_39490 [Rhizobium ruizarguesonis]TCA23658.1 hypothetical protein E0H66_36255 [Rhizobium leguminosarum bv. viciae]